LAADLKHRLGVFRKVAGLFRVGWGLVLGQADGRLGEKGEPVYQEWGEALRDSVAVPADIFTSFTRRWHKMEHSEMEYQEKGKFCMARCNCKGKRCILSHDHCPWRDDKGCEDGCVGVCKEMWGHSGAHWCNHDHAF